MRKIFNEKKEVERLLKEGFYSNSYSVVTDNKFNTKSQYVDTQRCIALLTKHFSAEGKKPKEIKELIKTKYWKNYNGYDVDDIKLVNKTVDKVRRAKNYNLISVDTITLKSDDIKWFKNLMNEDLKAIHMCPVKKDGVDAYEPFERDDKGIDWNMCKILFTLYVWAIIQKQYKGKYWYRVSLNGSTNRLKRAADCPASYDIKNSLNILFDFGFLEEYFTMFDEVAAKKLLSPRMFEEYNDKYPSQELYKMLAKLDSAHTYELYFTEDEFISRAYKCEDVTYSKMPGTGEDVVISIEDIGECAGKWLCDYLGVEKTIRRQKQTLPKERVCACCGKPVENKSHRLEVYCDDCRKTRERERAKANRAKAKEKKLMEITSWNDKEKQFAPILEYQDEK